MVVTAEQAKRCAAVLSKMRGCASIIEREEVCIPIFTTSAITGVGLQLLHSFLRALEPARRRRDRLPMLMPSSSTRDPCAPGGDPCAPGGDPCAPGGDPCAPGGDPCAPGGEAEAYDSELQTIVMPSDPVLFQVCSISGREEAAVVDE
jgi:hypothetical protein